MSEKFSDTESESDLPITNRSQVFIECAVCNAIWNIFYEDRTELIRFLVSGIALYVCYLQFFLSTSRVR